MRETEVAASVARPLTCATPERARGVALPSDRAPVSVPNPSRCGMVRSARCATRA